MFRNAGRTESGEDIQQIYKTLREQNKQDITNNQEEYSPQEESLIKELKKA